MRLINADALKEELRNSWIRKAKMPMEADPFLAFAMSDIDNAPTIDAEPVKHGKWTVDEKHTEEIYTNPVYCSVCGKDVVMDYGEYAPYCPNCGAKMDKEVEP